MAANKPKIEHKLNPFLWFDTQAEDAVKFYTTVFKNSKVGTIARYGKAGPGPDGSVMTATFILEGIEFIALNAGPLFKFTEAISFVVNCGDQEEVDYYWEKLSAGGEKSMCGWLKDKFGLSWQVVPVQLTELMLDKDPDKAARVMQAMMKMKKIDISLLKAAYDQSPETKKLSPA